MLPIAEPWSAIGWSSEPTMSPAPGAGWTPN